MHFLSIYLIDRNAVDENPSAVQIIETHQQIYECRFPGARWTDDRDFLTWLNGNGKVLNDDIVRFIGVAEAYMAENDLSFNIFNCSCFGGFVR